MPKQLPILLTYEQEEKMYIGGLLWDRRENTLEIVIPKRKLTTLQSFRQFETNLLSAFTILYDPIY